MMGSSYKTILAIAGSDSSGGAGIQADVKTISALGHYATTAITAVTAQNTQIVKSVHPIPTNFVEDQLQAIFDDIRVDAIKIGMVFNKQIARAVHDKINRLSVPIVLDPVMISTTGQNLIKDVTVNYLRSHLCPISTIITPNRFETEVLANRKVSSKSDIEKVMADLLSLGSKAVLIKGGHFRGSELHDFLGYYEGTRLQVTVFSHSKIKTRNTHGTGCTLASAIACFLSEGMEIKSAVKNATDYVHAAIIAGTNCRLGKGKGPLRHFFSGSSIGPDIAILK